MELSSGSAVNGCNHAAVAGQRDRKGPKVVRDWISGHDPAWIEIGLAGGLVPPAVVPTVSTPVRIVKGSPDCHSLNPVSCYPLKTWRRTALLKWKREFRRGNAQRSHGPAKTERLHSFR